MARHLLPAQLARPRRRTTGTPGRIGRAGGGKGFSGCDRCDALAGAGERPGPCPQSDGARNTDASGGERGSDRSAGAQLGRAGRQAGGNSGAENPEAEQREGCQHQRERILERRLVGAEPLGELAEQRGSDADDDRQHQYLDARRDDVAQHPLGEERRLAEQAERHEDEAGKRRELEFDQGDEQLHGQDEKSDENDEPRNQQDEDLDEVLEERHEAHELTGGLQDRLAGINAVTRGVERLHHAGLHAERIVVCGERILPARLRIVEELLGRGRAGVALRIAALERLVDLADVVGETLGLADQLLGPRHRLLDGLPRGIRQAREIPRLVEQHLCLVLQAGDLVVDLLQRASGLQHVLGVVRGVIDDHLPATRHGCEREADEGRADQRNAAQAMSPHRVTSSAG